MRFWKKGYARLLVIALFAGEAYALADATQEGPPERRLTLLQIADTHAQLETHPEYLPGETPDLQAMGGFARIKTAVDRARSDAVGPTFFVDGGDTFQGSAPAAWAKGEAVVGPLNVLGLDVCVPGNWEPVYGATQMQKLLGNGFRFSPPIPPGPVTEEISGTCCRWMLG